MNNQISRERFQAVVDRLAEGPVAFLIVARDLGVPIECVVRIADGKHAYQNGSRKGERTGNSLAANSPRRELKGNAVYLPTPEQIEIECARLRAARIVDEEDPGGWTPPIYSERFLAACHA